MTSMLPSQAPRKPVGVLALPLSVEGMDDSEVYVPRDIIKGGSKFRIPYWLLPELDDRLWIIKIHNGVEETIYNVKYPTPLTVEFLYFDLTPKHLEVDGPIDFYYKIWKGDAGNDDPSPIRHLFIDRTPLAWLKLPWFIHATLWGYLNRNTNPPMTSGVTISFPSFKNIAVRGDVAKITFRGYSSLNASGPEVPGTYGVWDKELSESDIANGFDHVVPYLKHISPLFDNSSAIAVCQLLRNGRLIAESERSLVKIDQVIPGQSSPSGFNEGEMQMTAQQQVTFKARENPPKLGASVNGIFTTAITVDTIADDFIPKSQLDTGKVIIKLAALSQPEEDDDYDVWAAVAGQPLQQILYGILGPIADRTDPMLIEIDKALLPDLPQPATPTAYDLQVLVYKNGAGTDDPSNVVSVVIDENPPFGLKFPTKRLTPPTPNATFTNAPADAQRLVNEAWMQANANLQLVFGVAYPNRRLDDKLELHLVSGVAPNIVDIVVFDAVVPASGAITVPNTELRKHRNGRVMAHYFWTDHVGNRSASSTPAALLTLGLALDPVLRKAPLVPATDPNATTTIYLDNFLKPDGTEEPISSIVERAFIDNLEPGDEVQVYIEDALDPTNFKMLGPVAITNADVTFPVPYTGFFADLFGPYEEASEFKIWAEVVRGANTFPSPELFFWADLYPAGGLYPELPELVNPAFALPVTTGASNVPNTLQPGDRDKPGKIEVTLALADPPLNSTETAKFYLDGKYVDEVSPFADMTTFSVTVPAITIGALPTPTVKAHWTRQKTGIDKNVVSSPSQDVAVSGKKIDLLQPTIRIRNPLKDQCDCFAMNNAATNWRLALGIPKDPVNLPVGTVITVHMEAHSNATATALIPNTADSQPYTILAAGTPDVASVGTAAIFKLAQPKQNALAWIKLWYTANIGGVQTSIELVKKLDTITSSAEYCDRTPVPAT
ncbi:hypothetical protein [Pseudomonas fluorescens]|uniref:hypothetical protein n=1 Tax=Pseudomonas fluorescens TaxID=294 RepID=UPI00259BE2F2|nr:hypothetical protein [Pseudomonas fluorescens]WJK07341.1 hypothetical protein QR290_16050 [Pseudomonas fluorescens]